MYWLLFGLVVAWLLIISWFDLRKGEIPPIKVFLPGLLLTLYWANEKYLIGALAILGFWIAWELRWWGGADAITAITLCLFWPTLDYLLALLIINTLAVAFLSIFSLLSERKIKLHKIPGLPLFLLAVICLQITKL